MMDGAANQDFLFEVLTPLGFRVHVTRTYWELIVTIKHPAMRGRETDIRERLERPDEIRLSSSDSTLYLFYRAKRTGRWVCAVSKRLDEEDFLITAYPTDVIKEGTKIWPR